MHSLFPCFQVSSPLSFSVVSSSRFFLASLSKQQTLLWRLAILLAAPQLLSPTRTNVFQTKYRAEADADKPLGSVAWGRGHGERRNWRIMYEPFWSGKPPGSNSRRGFYSSSFLLALICSCILGCFWSLLTGSPLREHRFQVAFVLETVCLFSVLFTFCRSFYISIITRSELELSLSSCWHKAQYLARLPLCRAKWRPCPGRSSCEHQTTACLFFSFLFFSFCLHWVIQHMW